jgi:glycine oxidase
MSGVTADVLVVGAGIVGAACARALALAGARVRWLERAAPEAPTDGMASPVAAGILGAQIDPTVGGPLGALCVAGRERWAGFARAIEEASGVRVGYARPGAMRVAFGEAGLAALRADAEAQRAAGLRAEILDAGAARRRAPELAREVIGALWLEDEAVVDAALALDAARRAAVRAGAALRSGARVRALRSEGDRACGVELEGGERISGGAVVLAAGSWLGEIAGVGLVPGAVLPVRGQMIELDAGSAVGSATLEGPDAYLVSRGGGRVLVGSTVERVGFETGATAGEIARLLAGAVAVAPALSAAHVVRCYSGLRPGSADDAPLLGPGVRAGSFVAGGHYRNGILLAPVTGEVIAALVAGAPPPPGVDLAPFDPRRFAV